MLGEFRFFSALPKIKGEGGSLEQSNTQTPLNRLVPNVVKPLGPICNKENAGATSTKLTILQTPNLVEQKFRMINADHSRS